MLKRIEGNELGDDYFITDLHGCMDIFQGFIKGKKLGKNARIFLSGDIIDRGPQSLELIKFILSNNESYERAVIIQK
jgi:hypothetical protein